MKRKLYFAFSVLAMFAVLVFSSCASKKHVSSHGDEHIASKTEMLKHNKEIFSKIQKNSVTNDALSAKMKFIVESSGKSMSVAGQMEMKKDTYLRLRVTPLGMFEVAMIEFTTDHVLILDRMHKEYIKADYSEIPFLQANGIDFYALQSLFRNMVFVPGESHLNGESYKQFEIHAKNGKLVLSANKGKLNYSWFLDSMSGMIQKAEVAYMSGNGHSKMDCYYSDFANVAGKSFPHKISMNFSTNMLKDFKNLTLTVISKKIKTEQKGDGKITNVPRKYAEKDVRKMLNNILEVK